MPLEPRFFWRQRLRWLKGGHLYVTGEGSLFFEKQPHMSFWQKSLYWLCPVSHFVQIWAEPIMFTLPFLCVVLDVCPYGMDRTIFASHVIFFGVMSINSFYYNDFWLMGNALRSKTGSRVLWFTAFKAVINTLMVHTGIKAKVRRLAHVCLTSCHVGVRSTRGTCRTALAAAHRAAYNA